MASAGTTEAESKTRLFDDATNDPDHVAEASNPPAPGIAFVPAAATPPALVVASSLGKETQKSPYPETSTAAVGGESACGESNDKAQRESSPSGAFASVSASAAAAVTAATSVLPGVESKAQDLVAPLAATRDGLRGRGEESASAESGGAVAGIGATVAQELFTVRYFIVERLRGKGRGQLEF